METMMMDDLNVKGQYLAGQLVPGSRSVNLTFGISGRQLHLVHCLLHRLDD
jgi:hypothetical protein